MAIEVHLVVKSFKNTLSPVCKAAVSKTYALRRYRPLNRHFECIERIHFDAVNPNLKSKYLRPFKNVSFQMNAIIFNFDVVVQNVVRIKYN